MENQKNAKMKTVKVRQMNVYLEVRFVPLSPEQLSAWRTGLSLLMDLLVGGTCDEPKADQLQEALTMEAADE